MAAAQALGPAAPPSLVVPPPVLRAPRGEPDAPGPAPDAVAYAGNPAKRGLDVLCAAWTAAAPDGATLAVGGLDRAEALRWLSRAGTPEPPGVEWVGRLEPERWRALVASSRVFVNASRQEEWGLAQMEALAAGTPLVTVPTPGPNVALPLARGLAPELVARDLSATSLADALRAAPGIHPGPARALRGAGRAAAGALPRGARTAGGG